MTKLWLQFDVATPFRMPFRCPSSDPSLIWKCVMYKIVQSSRLYEQIVRQIEDSIEKGVLKAGINSLPSANWHFSLASVEPLFGKR